MAATLGGLLLAGCGSSLPTPECDPGGPYPVTIGCEQAVSLAHAQLRSGHPDITRIQFLYGSYQPFLPQVRWTGAYVVFTFADRSRRAVQLNLLGGKVTTESPGPY